jgi:RNA polymerase sigma-70 factor (ECF subfamily)
MRICVATQVERSSQESDAERALVARLLVDEADAWRTFDAKYSRVVLGCIHRVLSRFARVTGADDVDEIYARFCLQLLAHDKKKLRTFDPERGSKLSSWLGLLATHAAYDYLRSLRRDSGIEPLTETERVSSDAPSPYEMSLLHERARIAAQVMSQLSERDREFVELYFGEGLEPEEIAREMGINVKTVYSKKHKITARLESLLASAQAAA